MSKYPKCERCPDQHTKECDNCKPEPAYIGTEDAIKYFKEDNEYYERVLGENAKLLKEYRVNQMAIDALKEKLSR